MNEWHPLVDASKKIVVLPRLGTQTLFFQVECVAHDMEPEDIAQSFRILRKCQNKFD